MPKFHYRAKKMTGEEIEETQEAEDRFELARELRKDGYIIISLKEEGAKRKKASPFSFIFSIFSRVSTSEKMIFSRNLAVMLSAGLPISRALSALMRQTKNKKFQSVLAGLGNSLQKGEVLSRAMERYPDIFSNLFTAMVKAGERSGKLPESLNLISQQLERDLTLRKRVMGALMYPSIIIIAMIAIGILMLIFVVPTLVSTFMELNIELPVTTRTIIFVSNFITNNGVLVALAFFIAISAVLWAVRTKQGKYLSDFLFLRFPFFSSLTKKINSSRSARTLSSLLSSGVDIVEAFDITENVLQNHYYKEVLKKAGAEIQKGSPIAQVFIAAENLYPPLLGEMVAVGEETGQLPNMLLQLASFYEEEVAETTKNLTTIIEPILMIFIGAVVGFFAISMIQPMYSMMGGL